MVVIVILVVGRMWIIRPVAERPIPIDDTTAVNKFLSQVERIRIVRHSNYYDEDIDRQSLTPIRFDPNTADSTMLITMGLPRFVVNNILRYRHKGGRFRTPEAFSKIYGLRSDMYSQLLPYVSIDQTPFLRDSLLRASHRLSDSLKYPMKLSEGTKINLNTADTALLRRVPGIGVGYSQLIVQYRMRLGGYVKVDQLLEIPGIRADVLPWFELGRIEIKKIAVNRLSLDRLRAHPYINFYQARAIVEYRRRHGPIRNITRLSLFDVFNADDLERLSPYLTFEE